AASGGRVRVDAQRPQPLGQPVGAVLLVVGAALLVVGALLGLAGALFLGKGEAVFVLAAGEDEGAVDVVGAGGNAPWLPVLARPRPDVQLGLPAPQPPALVGLHRLIFAVGQVPALQLPAVGVVEDIFRGAKPLLVQGLLGGPVGVRRAGREQLDDQVGVLAV